MTDIPETVRGILVSPRTSILDAVEILNDRHLRIILITDETDRLLGVVADSNVRRAVLGKVDFARPVSDIMMAQPITAKIGTGVEEIRALMERTGIHEIPLIDDDGRVRDLRVVDDVLRRADDGGHTAVVMAGGLGSRLKPLTDDTPKPLLEVGGKPILFTILDHLIEADFTTIYLALNYKAEMIRDAVSGVEAYTGKVRFIEEDKRLGTAGALALLPETPRSPFLVLNGDLLTNVALREMVRFHSFERNLITVALKQESFAIPFGVATVEGTRILELKEKPEHSVFLNAGVYVVDPVILDRIPTGEYTDMPGVIEDVLSDGLRVGSFPVHEYWVDIGVPSQLEAAIKSFGENFL